MKQKDKLAILDGQLYELFAENYGSSLDVDFKSWLHLITTAGPSERMFNRLNALAFFVFVERSGASFGDSPRFKVTSRLSKFQKFIYSINLFLAMDIPYKQWNSLAKVLYDTLSEMVRQDELNFDSADCKKVTDHAAEIFSRIKNRPGFDETYTDFLNGAL